MQPPETQKRRPFFLRRAYYRNVRLIIRREFSTRIHRRSFQISTGIGAGVLFVLPFIALLVVRLNNQPAPTVTTSPQPEDQNKPVVKVAVLERGEGDYAVKAVDYLGKAFEADEDLDRGKTYALVRAGPEEYDTLRQQLADDKLAALAVIEPDEQRGFSFKYYSAESTSGRVDTAVRRGLERLSMRERLLKLGLDEAQINRAVASAETEFEIVSADSSVPSGSSGEKSADSNTRPRPGSYLVVILSIALFTAIFNYGMSIGQGAAEEKTSRIAEIIIAAATPFQLMLGKIVGIWMAGALQSALMLSGLVVGLLFQIPLLLLFPLKVATNVSSPVSSVASPAVSSAATSLVSSPGSSLNAVSNSVLGSGFGSVASSIVFFYPVAYLLGFMLWASLYAAVGAMATRQEEINFALTPLNFLALSNYFLVLFATQALDSLWVVILSYVPFFTPMLMFARLANGRAAWWEGVLAAGILLVSTFFFIWLSARVYRAGLLSYGRRPSLFQFFRLLWHKQ